MLPYLMRGYSDAYCILNAGVTVYEYIISFDQEIAHVWTRKLNVTSFLLLSIRWVMVVTQVISFSRFALSRCKSLLLCDAYGIMNLDS